MTHETRLSAPGASENQHGEMLRHSIAAFGFLIPRGARMPLLDFAAEIRRHCSHERAAEVATSLEQLKGEVHRDWTGIHAKWQH